MMLWQRQALFVLAMLLLSASTSVAQDRTRSSAAEIARYEAPFQRSYDVDGVQRKAAVFAPKSARQTPSPLILAFHGKGGDARKAAETMLYHLHWPEAIVVYPQGLNTPGGPDPEGKFSGWSNSPDESNRDIKFVDTLVGALRKDYQIDRRRVYATGQSNGGFFTYALWAARGDRIAAVAPCAALCEFEVSQLKPKPVTQVAGRKDPYLTWHSTPSFSSPIDSENSMAAGRADSGRSAVAESTRQRLARLS